MKQNQPLRYPIGVQSFSELREGGYVYIDKTALIHSLIKEGKYYFLSRPRRFGKSLLLSTIEAYYKGRRELFKGLALDRLRDDWTPHPVLHLDLNYATYDTPDSLTDLLSQRLDEWEASFGLAESTSSSPSVRFNAVIKKAFHSTGQKVVILIDEYDKPLLNSISNPKLSEKFRTQLKAFYANLKTMDACIEFAMLTGVAKFSKVSIFSDLNNLRDITFSNDYASICGITSSEVEQYFADGLSALAKEMHRSEEEVRNELKSRYDGYHFAIKSPDIYNPFSLMNVFADRSMRSYWFDTGTPTYLFRLIQRGHYLFREIAPSVIDREYLESAGLLDDNPDPVFYQSGYLTIKSYDPDYDTYTLDYPNTEVRQGFLKFLMRSYIPDSFSKKGLSIPDFVEAVREGRPEEFMRGLESLIASIPYADKGSSEDHFQNAIYLLFALLGFSARIEDRTSDGRIDLQVETSRFIYIFEFKIDSSSEKAMEQIRSKKYWLRESFSGKEIFLIGANFDTETKRLTPPIIAHP